MSPLRGLSALLLVLLCAGCAVTGRLDPRTAAYPAPEVALPVPARAELSGGAPVFLLEDHDVPLVRLFLATRGGAVYDPEEKAGLSAVTESAWRTGGAGDLSPEAFDEALDDRAVDLSLSVGREITRVRLSVLPEDLETALDLLEELLLRPAFRKDRVEWALSQVEEHLRREADDPQTLAFRELRRALYRGHPRGMIPSPATVRRVTREDVVDLQQRLLREGAWVVGAVGDFAAADLLPRLEARFGDLPGRGSGFPPLPAPALPEPRLILVPKTLPQATVVWARLGPARTDPAFYAMDLLDQAVGSGGFQSRLVREIRSNRGLAYSVGSFYDATPSFGVLGAYASTRAEETGRVSGLLRGILAEVAAHGLAPPELERAREAALNRHVFRYEDPAAIVREQMRLHLHGLPPDLPGRYGAEIRAVTQEEADRVAQEYYRSGPGVTVVVGSVDPGSLTREGGPPLETEPTP